MTLVQAVNGFGRQVDRSVARPYMYGRGMIATDPAYTPYLGGVYSPVTVSYTGNSIRTWTYNQPGGGDEFAAQRKLRGVVTHGETAPLPGPNRSEYERRQVAEEPEDTGAALVQQPKKGGKKDADDRWHAERLELLANPGGEAGGAGNLKAPGAATPAASGAVRSAANNPQRNTGLVGRPATGPGGLQNLPKNVRATLGPGQWLMDARYMEDIRDAAVKQYVGKNNEWAKGAGVPLGIGGESKYKGITKEAQLAAMFQVVPSKYTGPRPAAPGARDISVGHPSADRMRRGTLVQYDVYAPAFSHQTAINAYYDMGLWRKPDEVLNWKRTFNALGYYDPKARPNIGSTGWGKFETDAMAKFMADANGNPQAAQSVADLSNVRDDLLRQAAEMDKASGGGGGGAGGGAFNTTQTTTNVQLSNLEDARETLRGQITNMIGRFPTDAEVRQFLGKLNSYERAHPTTTTTKTASPDGSNITQTVSGSRGDNIDPFHIAQEYAKKNTPGDYHAYQQLRYYQALSDIIGSPQATQSIPQGG